MGVFGGEEARVHGVPSTKGVHFGVVSLLLEPCLHFVHIDFEDIEALCSSACLPPCTHYTLQPSALYWCHRLLTQRESHLLNYKLKSLCQSPSPPQVLKALKSLKEEQKE